MTQASAGGPLACSEWARSQDLSPIGSAGHYRGYLLVELPLPWPSDVSQVAELAEVTGLADQAGLRLQAIAPAGGAVEGPRRLIYFAGSRPGWAGPLSRRERLAEPGAGPLAAAVAAPPRRRGRPATGTGPRARAGGRPGVHARPTGRVLRGERDRAGPGVGGEPASGRPSGGGGRPKSGGDGPERGPAVRLWRTSHTGGHRFAPTALVLPSATLWAWADAALVDQVVRTQGPVSNVVEPLPGLRHPGAPRPSGGGKVRLGRGGLAPTELLAPGLGRGGRLGQVGDGFGGHLGGTGGRGPPRASTRMPDTARAGLQAKRRMGGGRAPPGRARLRPRRRGPG